GIWVCHAKLVILAFGQRPLPVENQLRRKNPLWKIDVNMHTHRLSWLGCDPEHRVDANRESHKRTRSKAKFPENEYRSGGLRIARLLAMSAILHDLRYAFRLLLRQKAFTFLALSTLALGIGANSAIFAVVNAVLLRPLPFRDPGRLVLIET